MSSKTVSQSCMTVMSAGAGIVTEPKGVSMTISLRSWISGAMAIVVTMVSNNGSKLKRRSHL